MARTAPSSHHNAATASTQKRIHQDGNRTGRFTLADLDRRLQERREQLQAGWHLTRVEDGVKGWFEMARIRQLPKGKLGSVASFNVVLHDVLYLGQFHLSEQTQPMEKPTAWDNSKGAKAGLLSLGKRK